MLLPVYSIHRTFLIGKSIPTPPWKKEMQQWTKKSTNRKAVISSELWNYLQFSAMKADGIEISGGFVVIQEGDVLNIPWGKFVDSVGHPSQVTTDLWGTFYIEGIEAGYTDKEITGQMHLHPSMAAFWSSTDEENQYNIIKYFQRFSKENWFIFLVYSDHNDVLVRVVEWNEYGVFYEDIPTEMSLTYGDETITVKFDGKKQEIVRTNYTSYFGRYYDTGGNHTLDGRRVINLLKESNELKDTAKVAEAKRIFDESSFKAEIGDDVWTDANVPLYIANQITDWEEDNEENTGVRIIKLLKDSNEGRDKDKVAEAKTLFMGGNSTTLLNTIWNGKSVPDWILQLTIDWYDEKENN